MDVSKIGAFISECRKEKKLTQEQLAEKLYITDRAVSKWERGLSLPDADKMLDLCNILDINVNELLNGERIDMKDYDKKNEELLIELARQEEIKNKRLITDMYVLTITAFIFYTALIIISAVTLGEGPVFAAIVVISTIILLIVCFYGFKLEVEAGYYECRHCHHRFENKNYFKLLCAPHAGTSRYLKCPECGKRSMAKKVMTKE